MQEKQRSLMNGVGLLLTAVAGLGLVAIVVFASPALLHMSDTGKVAKVVALPPALTIISQTVLGSLFGALGPILATPFAAAFMVGVRMVYIEGLLERCRAETDDGHAP